MLGTDCEAGRYRYVLLYSLVESPEYRPDRRSGPDRMETYQATVHELTDEFTVVDSNGVE